MPVIWDDLWKQKQHSHLSVRMMWFPDLILFLLTAPIPAPPKGSFFYWVPISGFPLLMRLLAVLLLSFGPARSQPSIAIYNATVDYSQSQVLFISESRLPFLLHYMCLQLFCSHILLNYFVLTFFWISDSPKGCACHAACCYNVPVVDYDWSHNSNIHRFQFSKR